MKQMLHVKKSNTQLYTVSVRTFEVPFHYGSGFRNRTYYYYGSGSAKAKSYGSYGSSYGSQH